MHNDLFSRWHLLIICLFAENPQTYYICTYKIYVPCLCYDMQWFIRPGPLITSPYCSDGQAFLLFLLSIKQRKSFFPHNIAKFFSPNMLTLTKPDHDHGVSNTYEYAKQSLPGQSDKWNIHASDEHTYSNKSSMPHRQSMIFTQICSGTLMGQNKVDTRAHNLWKFDCRAITINGIW